MKKKILLILLVLSLTVSVLAACGGDENPSAQEGGTTAEQESSALAEPILPDLDYDFASVTIHIRNDDETIKEIGLDQTGEALSSELFRRNEAVQEQLNVELKVVKSEGWQNYNAAINSLRDSILNNLGTFDLVATWSPRGPILAAEGIRLAFHNHAGEFKVKPWGSTIHGELERRTGIDFEIDTFWTYAAGVDSVAVLKRLKDRIRVIHLKDGYADGKGIPLGRGAAPVKDVIAYASGQGWRMVVESETLTPSGLDEAAACMEYLKIEG